MCDILVSKCDSPFNAYAKGILAQKRDTMTDLSTDWGGVSRNQALCKLIKLERTPYLN
jgi:hypothetical protein